MKSSFYLSIITAWSVCIWSFFDLYLDWIVCLCLVWMPQNTDQKSSKYGHSSHSAWIFLFYYTGFRIKNCEKLWNRLWKRLPVYRKSGFLCKKKLKTSQEYHLHRGYLHFVDTKCRFWTSLQILELPKQYHILQHVSAFYLKFLSEKEKRNNKILVNT